MVGHIDKMQQNTASLDMAQESVAKSGTTMSPLDQPRNVSHDKFAFIRADDT